MKGERYDRMFSRRPRGVFVPFTMIGDGGMEASIEVMSMLIEAGADALELGIPFSDPVADGAVIQAASVRALLSGTTPSGCLEAVSIIRAKYPEVPIGLLTYANLLVAMGLDRFYRQASRCGVDSVLVADVPLHEAAPFADSARKHRICPVLIAPPNAGPERLQAIASMTEGYTYVVARAGITGADENVEIIHAPIFQALRSYGAPPAMVGFGISRPEHVRKVLAAGASGAISGSAVVALVAEGLNGELVRFVREMKEACA